MSLAPSRNYRRAAQERAAEIAAARILLAMFLRRSFADAIERRRP